MEAKLVSRFVIGLGLGSLVTLIACGSAADRGSGSSTFIDDPDQGKDRSGPLGTFPPERGVSCVGLECQQIECNSGVKTTLTGIVTAPNGTLPLYNAIVYVPNAPLEPLVDGTTCDRCGSVSGKPLVSTLTDVEGRFELRDVPVGEKIPLVIQIGKWRKQITVPTISQCVTNDVADRTLTRLPRNRHEGDIPRIAVTTGRCDQLACLLPKLGLDPAEFSSSDGDGRLHLYRGAGHKMGGETAKVPAPAPDGTRDASELWADPAKMRSYDILLMSCECGEHDSELPTGAKTNLYDYSSSGGRVFASHFHYTWADSGPLAETAHWMGDKDNPERPAGPYLVDQSFAKGEALAKWLVNVDATDTLGRIPISEPRENVGGVVAPAQRWVYSDTRNESRVDEAPQATKYMSVNTPVARPVPEQCGKFVFADMHLYGGDEMLDPTKALPNNEFPRSCDPELTPEEKALAFLFFDLSSCIQDDAKPPVPPVK
jgi:hypothetical protein